MDIKCNCNMTTRLVGDGCDLCNTEYSIDIMPTPSELADELGNEGFSIDQASYIASSVYQPLLHLITVLNNKIEQVRRG